MQIIDFEALRQRGQMRRRRRLTVLSVADADDGWIVSLPSALVWWAAEEVRTPIPDPEPGPGPGAA